MNTTPHQILDIYDALVSDENPAREDGMAYGWMAHHGKDTSDLDALARNKRFVRTAEDERAIRERLDSPLTSFLDSIYYPQVEFFYWVCSLEMRDCDDSFPLEDNELEDGKARFIVIYDTESGLGPRSLGIVYDQQLHRASVTMTIENTQSVEPVDEHDDLWFPLETILTHWIYMIDLDRGLWPWLPYCDAQVDSTIATMEGYSAAVESRMPTGSLLQISAPLFTDADLDAALVPQDCFIRSLLTRLKTPRFKFIAPGLEVPYDKKAFVRRQTSTNIVHKKDSIPAVLLFAAPDRTVNLKFEIRSLFSTPHENFTMNDGDPVPTGLYSEPLCRGHSDTEEAGFRLLLPFALRPDPRDD
ncbi:hypothetical protein N7488_009414 [Penicillium malachiteum]|nr:hypothetical protein N7488_009414 [Penicillium malachiteum]